MTLATIHDALDDRAHVKAGSVTSTDVAAPFCGWCGRGRLRGCDCKQRQVLPSSCGWQGHMQDNPAESREEGGSARLARQQMTHRVVRRQRTYCFCRVCMACCSTSCPALQETSAMLRSPGDDRC